MILAELDTMKEPETKNAIMVWKKREGNGREAQTNGTGLA